jgi:hypothetical protein
MAEFAYNPVQLVEPNQNIILDTVIPCNKGYVFHRDQSGIVILRGIVNCQQACFARYQVTFNGNIALPADATVIGPISIALAIDGEPVQTSRAIVTPADAADDPPTQANFFNVTSTAIITVPKGCCFTVAVENTSGPAVAGGVAPEILVQNANLTVSRIS